MSLDVFSQFCQWFQGLDESQKVEASRQFRQTTGGTLSGYCNPKPVAVALVPVVTVEGVKLLGLRRAIEPRKGTLALPGGFMGEGESVEAAAAREVLEETGIPISAQSFALFDRPQPASGGTLLLFCLSRVILTAEQFDLFNQKFEQSSDGEAMDLTLVGPTDTLGFPLHQAAANEFFGP